MEENKSDIKILKDRVRKSVKNRLSFLTSSYKKEASEFITDKVKKLPEYMNAKRLMLYCSTADEPDTEALISAALKAGKIVLLPRCLGKGEMEAVEIQSMEDLQVGKYGILEPLAALPPTDPKDIDFIVVPCMAAGIDEKGRVRRLGHGAGYYDRFLPGVNCRSCVLCFKELVRDFPMDDYDYFLDYLITE